MKLGRKQERCAPVIELKSPSKAKLPLLESLQRAGYLNGLVLTGGRLETRGTLESLDLTDCRMASNLAHQHYLVDTEKYKAAADEWKKEGKPVWPAWAREILASMGAGQEFRKGADVFDAHTGWRLPASYVPDEAMGEANVGLLIVPQMLEFPQGFETACHFKYDGNEEVIVHPASVKVLAPLPRPLAPLNDDTPNTIRPADFPGWGRVDEDTGLLIDIDPEKLSDYPKKGTLRRRTDAGVRPLARTDAVHGVTGFVGYYRTDVSAREYPYYDFAVMLEASV